MNVRLIVEFANLFCAGILAGVEVVVHYGLPNPLVIPDEPTRLRFRQALMRKLRVLVPAFFVPTALSGIEVVVLGGGMPGGGFRYAGLAALLLWILIRVVGTVPVNSATLDWQPDAPPNDWQAQIDHAERFNIVGAWSAVIAFAFFLVAAALRLQV